MKQNLKLKGRLKNYLYLPMYINIFLILLNILIYFEDKRAGMILTGFIFLYSVCVFVFYIRNKPALTKEMGQ